MSKTKKEIEHSQAYMKMMDTVDVSSRQVGGAHYQNKIQPWELNFYEGNILKYLLRTKKDRVEDLQKLIHYAEKLLERELLCK